MFMCFGCTVVLSVVTVIWLCRAQEFRCFPAKFSSWVLISVVSSVLKMLPLQTGFSVLIVLLNG